MPPSSGVSQEESLIATVDGIVEVEAFPEPVTWTSEPEIGARLEIAEELRSAPFIAELTVGGDRQDAFATIEQSVRRS